MAKKDVDVDGVRISSPPPPNSALKHVDDVFIVVTQAFCPNGHNLVDENDRREENLFDGYPGIKLHVTQNGQEGEVILSPFHGDCTKKGKTDWNSGAKLEVRCPVCKELLPRMASCRCEGNGDLILLYLTPKLSDSHILGLCNVWGCRRSRTINNWQIISEYLDGSITD